MIDLLGPVEEVAPRLLGCLVVAHGVTVRLTEVEAYAGERDAGSHAYRGRTPRSAIMFGPPGRLYVYFSYGMHWCANVVTGPDGEASAVLLRAGAVVDGLELARERRRTTRDRDLARGPARLAQALALDRAVLGADVLDDASPVRLRPGPPPDSFSRGPRVGLSAAADVAWRFWSTGDPTVSPYRRGRVLR